MQEIISRINNLSLQTNEEEIEGLLNELKNQLIQNPDLSKSLLNVNFIKSAENWIEEFDNLAVLCFDVLEISLTNFKIIDSDSFSVIELFLSSNHQIARIAIRKLQQSYTEVSTFVPKSTVLLLIQGINSQHVNIGPPSIDLLVEFLSNNNFLDDADIKFQLASSANSSNSEVVCRVYEVCVKIAVKEFTLFEKVQFVIDKGVNELTTGTDVLLQLNLLDILQVLCLKDYGLSYLENKDLLKRLARKIEEVNEDPLTALLTPDLMKFFGSIAAIYPQKLFQNYSSLFELLFNCVLENQLTIIYSAFDTLGFLSKSNDCKKSLDRDFGHKFVHVLSHVYHSIVNYPSDVKLRAFNCLESAFSIDGDPEMVNNQITFICEKWCIGIFSNAVDLTSLLNYCKTPFDDLSQASFGFLKSLAYHSFGQKGIAQSAGFVEFLLDRKVGSTFEVKKIKYEVVEILSKSNIFEATAIAQFCKYVREGPSYVEPMSEVSFEPS